MIFSFVKEPVSGYIYHIACANNGERKDYYFRELDDAVFCFYGKVAETRLRHVKTDELTMSLFGSDGKLLINYHHDANEDKCMDLRPDTIN